MRRLGFGVSLLILTAMGCSSPDSATDGSQARRGDSSEEGAPAVADAGGALDATRTLGPGLRLDALTVWPVFTTTPVDLGEFMTLEVAQEKGLAELKELGGGDAAQVANAPAQSSDPGDGEQVQLQQELGGNAEVGTLELTNKGDRPILVLAGTVVKGGKQDRQIGQDFVVAAGSTVKVDAFCVEHGRWSAQRDGAETGGLFKGQAVMASKEVRLNAQYFSDQGKVWDEVSATNSAAGNSPETSTLLATIEEDDVAAKAYRERAAKAVRDHFEAVDRDSQSGTLVGYAYAIDGKIVGLRAFANRAVFDTQWGACLKTIGLEADLAQRKRAAGDAPQPTPVSGADVKAFVDEVRSVRAEERAAGANKNFYRKADRGGNAACKVKAADGTWQTLTEDYTTW